MLDENLTILRIGGEIGRLAGIGLQIHEGLAPLTVAVNTILVSLRADHPALQRGFHSVDHTALDQVVLDDDVIAPLKAELDLLAGRRVVQQDKADEARAITIMGDKDIPYRLLRRVMVTCARAGFSDVAFAVQRRDS